MTYWSIYLNKISATLVAVTYFVKEDLCATMFNTTSSAVGAVEISLSDLGFQKNKKI